MYYNLFDSHSHSENSPDASHSITFMAENAIAKGLQGLAITDHFDCEILDEYKFDKRIMQSAIDTAMAKIAFGGKLILTLGIEIGQVFYNLEAIEEVLERHRFDFVIGSLHKLLRDGFDYYLTKDYTELTGEELHSYNLTYFEELIDMINWGKFDVLGHLSFPLRYPKLYNGIDIDFARYKEPLDEVLKLAVQKGKGIEINTSGLRNAMQDTMPPAWAIKRFHELGGEIVTIGSDAHNVEDLGEGIGQAMQILADAGYEYFAFYRDRKPVMLRII